MRMKTELLNAYFAGLIDGEGYISIRAQTTGVCRPMVRVNMTCEETVRRLHDHFGGYFGKKAVEVRPNRKPQWTWEATFKNAHNVCEALRPYLVTKAAAADAVLQHYKSKQAPSK